MCRSPQLHFTNFTLEEHNDCIYDFLNIYNGPTTDSPLVDTYCGDNKPTTFQSGTNTVTLLFRTDKNAGRGGFRVEWSSDNSGEGLIGQVDSWELHVLKLKCRLGFARFLAHQAKKTYLNKMKWNEVFLSQRTLCEALRR